MKEHSILFTAYNIRSIRRLMKKETRRLKATPDRYKNWQIGDHLWVREAFARNIPGCEDQNGITYRADHDDPRGDGPANPIKWLSPYHMSRKEARMVLEITDKREQRLQDISIVDAIHEGVPDTWGGWFGKAPKWAVDSIMGHGDASGDHIWANRSSIENYRLMWESINGAGSWDDNPEVYAFSFKWLPEKSIV